MTPLTRADLQAIFGNNPKAIQAFEQLQSAVVTTSSQLASNTAATTALQDATVLTLSPNVTLTRERILALGDGLQAIDAGPGDTLTIFLRWVIELNGAFSCLFNLVANTELTLPTSGKVATIDLGGVTYADDTAAAAGGVAVGEMYRKTGGTVAWRVS